MAIIGKIRKHSALAVIIVGVAIAAFVIGDFGKKRQKGTTDIGSVDGEEISYLDFNNRVEENLEIQKKNMDEDKVSEEMAYNIRQSTWDNIVKNLVLGEEFDKLGLAVTSDELFELVQGQHPHRYILQYFKDPKTGAYDPALVLNYLRNLGKMEPKAKDQWLQFEKAIKEDQLDTKFNTLVIKAFYTPKALLKKDHELMTKSLNIRYISPAYYNIPDSLVTLTDEDYLKFYNKNKIYFFSEEPYADMDFVTFEVRPSGEDRSKIAQDVAGIYADFLTSQSPETFVSANSDKKYDTIFIKKGMLPARLDSLLFNSTPGTYIPLFEEKDAWYMAKLLATESRPDSMLAAQLLVTWAGLGVNEKVTRTQAQAKQRADSLLAVLKANPASFSDVAKATSDYPTAKDDGGVLPWFPDGNLNVSPFFEAGLTMKPNDMKIVETRLGYSLFKLTEKSEPNRKIKAAVLQRNIEPSNQTYQDTYTKASQFAGTYKTPEAFDSGAIATGLFKRQAQSVKEMDNSIQGLQNARNIVRWAFAEQTKPGEVAPVFDLTGVFAVVILKDRFAKGTQPLEKIKARIEPNVKNVKKIEIMSQRLQEAMKTNTDLYALAGSFGAKVDTTTLTFTGMNRAPIAREYEVAGTLFTLPTGQVKGPFSGNFGVYVVVVDQVLPPPSTEDFYYEKRIRDQGFTNRVGNSLYDALKNQSEIEDFRVLFY
ncbi:MAG: peptidylprolyl isomerase [bacterium]